MLVGAHQPHFLPWLGYFDKIRRSQLFCIVDHVQFERQNFQNRNRIAVQGRLQWLIVPVLQRSRAERIVDKEIDPAPDGRTTWEQKVLRSLHHGYARAPYYELYRADLEDILTRGHERLVDLDLALLRYFMAALEIDTPLVRSSELGGVEGSRSEMILSLCRAVGASAFLSGSGGSTRYLDRQLFSNAGVELCWQDFAHPIYPQRHAPPFIERLAVVDLLFHCGPASAAILRGEQPGHSEQVAAIQQEVGL